MSKENQPQIGGKIRRLRRQRQVSQGAVATAIGISASYLNLIEHNRRKITVQLLLKFAGYFGIEAGELAQSDDGQLVGDLMEAFGDDIFADTDITNQDIRDLAINNPVAARATLHLFDKYKGQMASIGDPANLQPAQIATHHQATDAISDFIQENANKVAELDI
ncbi:MAG: helix-turn-helix transcriptional regulator [Emcibacter sp.]|nr:helix-turn-helix transcriptional regulator [Emcibacter sp.]